MREKKVFLHQTNRQIVYQKFNEQDIYKEASQFQLLDHKRCPCISEPESIIYEDRNVSNESCLKAQCSVTSNLYCAHENAVLLIK